MPLVSAQGQECCCSVAGPLRGEGANGVCVCWRVCCRAPQVTKVEEEEYCLIPMGGVLPTHPQRVLGIGGTAGMVHPSTGALGVREARGGRRRCRRPMRSAGRVSLAAHVVQRPAALAPLPPAGFMISRALGAAPTVADAIVDALSRPADRATDATAARRRVTRAGDGQVGGRARAVPGTRGLRAHLASTCSVGP